MCSRRLVFILAAIATLVMPLLVHRGGKLRGDDFLDGVILARSQHALIGKEVVKGLLAHAAFPFLGHHVTSRLRFRARSMPACGVFCVFLMKPCSKIAVAHAENHPRDPWLVIPESIRAPDCAPPR
jgi:hypothetical protein